MSWSIQKRVGKPEAMRSVVAEDFDRCAKQYEGKTEATDVLAVKAAVMSMLDEASVGDAEGVQVEASGSRGQGWLSITVNCQRLALHT